MIYTANEIKRADATAKQQGMPETVLMERAASAVAHRLQLPDEASVLVVCGTGNNGGDGWVVARELAQRGHDVFVWSPLGAPKTDATSMHAAYAEQYVTIVDTPPSTDWIVDALYGIGLSGAVTGKGRDVISWLMSQPANIVSIDVPSGVPSDTAHDFDGHAVTATMTYTLHGFKRSAFLPKTAPYYGEVERVDIGLPHTSSWRVLTEADFDDSLLTRERFSHKTTYGRGLLIGGSEHLIGAPFLAGRAALRTGIGLLEMIVPEQASPLKVGLPEAMYTSADTIANKDVDAIAIGPGMVEGETLVRIWESVRKKTMPLVVDAGALSHAHLDAAGTLILTPHPGELARMTGQTVEEIEADRFGVARAFAMRHGIHLILKGTHTLIVTPEGTGAVNTVEASALAKGGSGDVLTGMLLAMWARCRRIETPHNPNEQAVLWHALAAKKMSESMHPASVLASDVVEAIGRIQKEES